MAILRGAPVWRGAKDGQQLLQCDGNEALFAMNVANACDESRSHEVITKTSYP
jgi:hypothetical protein